MLTKELIDYLAQCKRQNIDFKNISSQLAQQGWSIADIEEARKWYLPAPPDAPIPPQIDTIIDTSSENDDPIDNGQKTEVALTEEDLAKHRKETKSDSKKNKVVAISVIAFLLVITGIVTTSILIAYEKMSFPDSLIKESITYSIVNLPFMPKTPKYVVQKSLIENPKIKSGNMDLSLALSGDSVTNLVDINSFDLNIKGPFDYTDLNNPLFDLDITSQDLDITLLSANEKLYLKMSEIPALVFSTIGTDESVFENIQNNWYYYDYSGLDTDARQELDEMQSQLDLENQQEMTEYYNEILAPNLSMEKETIDDIKTYKMHLDVTPKFMQDTYIFFSDDLADDYPISEEDFSEYFETFTIDIWVTEKEYYLYKVVGKIAINVPSYENLVFDSLILNPTPSIEDQIQVLGAFDSRFDLVMSIKITNHNQPIIIEEPEDAMDIDNLYMTILENTMSLDGFYF